MPLFGPPQPAWNEWLALAARQREWEYRPLDPGVARRFRGYPMNHRGRTRHVLLGQHDGRHLVAFEHEYTSTRTDYHGNWDTDAYTHAVVALHLGVPVPDLSVSPTGVLRKMFGIGQDIRIGDPRFDEAFTVKSPSPEFAWDVLTAALPVLSRWQPMTWRFEGDSMVVIRSGNLTLPHVDAVLQFMDAVVDAIPGRVWQRLGGGPAQEVPR